MSSFSDRLAEERKKTGLTQAQFAELGGVKVGAQINYEKGERTPDAKYLMLLWQNNVDTNYIVTGIRNTTNEIINNEKEYADIPLFDIKAAAGDGSIIEEEKQIDVLHFKSDWIHSELHCNPSDLYLIYIDGESMEPTLRAGDVVLLNHKDTGPNRDGIYVMRMHDSLLVKRLQRLPNGDVRVSSDNPAYDKFDISVDERKNGFAIIGRVVWSGRRM